MPTIIPCFEPRQLERLLAGGVPADELDSAARHLEECARCAEALDRLLKQDTLLEAARTQTAADDGPEAAAVRALIDRVRALHVPPAVLTREATRELYHFLAPPEQHRMRSAGWAATGC
jgi:hypothetical protein